MTYDKIKGMSREELERELYKKAHMVKVLRARLRYADERQAELREQLDRPKLKSWTEPKQEITHMGEWLKMQREQTNNHKEQ